MVLRLAAEADESAVGSPTSERLFSFFVSLLGTKTAFQQ
jgi:hypothetical protein